MEVPTLQSLSGIESSSKPRKEKGWLHLSIPVDYRQEGFSPALTHIACNATSTLVGVPPTFFASMWDMNFKNIPEYDWSFGYQFGLIVIALSGIIPFVWFKWRGWW
jgi:hypothetical protein